MSYYHLAFGITVADRRSGKRRQDRRDGWLRSAAWRIAERRRARRDLLHLRSLPDYLLDDIGLTRGDLLAPPGFRGASGEDDREKP